jgi:hypothetical protein
MAEHNPVSGRLKSSPTANAMRFFIGGHTDWQ